MSQQLISRSPDLQRLQDDGYEVEVTPSNYLLIHNVPYVTAERKVQRATLGCPLVLAGNRTGQPDNHQAWFTGAMPCEQNGTPVNVAAGQCETNVAPSITFKWGFSSKPAGTPYPAGYADYYEKMTQYIRIISHPAWSLAKQTARTYRFITSQEDDSVFAYRDTASARVHITEATNKLKPHKLGIVGVGGTGSYILDLIAKTPVREIHLFDGDEFLNHNAFRTPGAASLDDVLAIRKKVDYLAAIYSKMHRKVIPHPYDLDASSVAEATALDYVFLCLDDGSAKRAIVTALELANVSFIDVGMGVELLDEEKSLGGILRVTTSTPVQRSHVHLKNRIPFNARDTNADYSQNIQIAELNALNAALAVIKWKKLCGFYQDPFNEHYSTYTIEWNMFLNDDYVNEP